MNLGNKILQLRKKNGLSQEQLGEKVEVTRQTISNWELGETTPNPEQLKKLGSKETFFRLKQRFPEVCLVHLYTLEGAITNTNFNELSKETKKDLKELTDEWK